jgi:hypothetical protein
MATGASSPHNLQFDDPDRISTINSLDLLCQLEKECHDNEAAIVQLKLQMLNERKRFEEEKQELITRQDELYYQVSRAEIFHSQLCSMLELDSSSECAAVIQEIQNRVGKISDQEQDHEVQNRLNEAKIREIDLRLKTTVQALEVARDDNRTKCKDIRKLQKHLKAREKQLRQADSQLQSCLQLTRKGTIEDSLQYIQKLKKRARKYKKIARSLTQADLVAMGEIQPIIDGQSALIHSAVKFLREANPNAADELQKRSRELKGVLDQILNGQVLREDEVPGLEQLDIDVEEQYDDLKTTIWLNRMREALSVERQIEAEERVRMNNSERMKLRMQTAAVKEANWMSPGVPFPSTYV